MTTETTHPIHEQHLHIHGPDCGHSPLEHAGHVDYLDDGHLHHAHDGHYDECVIAGHMPSEPHDHEHGEHCGHVQVRHDDHVDYLHDEHVHRPHDGHYDECASSVHQPAEEHIHVHGEGCGHAPVLHGDHLDYVHDGHRHAAHEGHYDEHLQTAVPDPAGHLQGRFASGRRNAKPATPSRHNGAEPPAAHQQRPRASAARLPGDRGHHAAGRVPAGGGVVFDPGGDPGPGGRPGREVLGPPQLELHREVPGLDHRVIQRTHPAHLLAEAQTFARRAEGDRDVLTALIGPPARRLPVPIENSATSADLGFHAACRYSLISPASLDRRRIRAAGTGKALTSGASSGARSPMPLPWWLRPLL